MPISVGPATTPVPLTMIDKPLNFNAIFGRTWIHVMKTLPSSYHKPEQVRLRTLLAAEKVASILSLLYEFTDVFAWSHVDMPGVLPELVEHLLSVRDSFKPVWKRLRWFHPAR